MNLPFSSKVFSWLVLILLLVNAITLGLFWFGKPMGPGPRHGKPEDFLIEKLHFNEKQKEAYLKLVQDHRSRSEELRDDLRSRKDAMFELAKKEAISDSAKKQVVMEVSILTEQLDLLTLDHFHEIRSICDPEQKEIFDSILKEITSMIAAPRPQGPPGPPPPGMERKPE